MVIFANHWHAKPYSLPSKGKEENAKLLNHSKATTYTISENLGIRRALIK
jgi:hypothetical protein